MHDLKTTVASRTLMRNYIAEMVEADSGWSDQNRDQGWLLDDVDELERQLAAAYSALGPGASRSIELHDHIFTLKENLAETNAGWDSSIADLLTAAKKCKERWGGR
jgi:hypothetical protein